MNNRCFFPLILMPPTHKFPFNFALLCVWIHVSAKKKLVLTAESCSYRSCWNSSGSQGFPSVCISVDTALQSTSKLERRAEIAKKKDFKKLFYCSVLTLSQQSLCFSMCVQKVRKCGLGSSSGNWILKPISKNKRMESCLKFLSVDYIFI